MGQAELRTISTQIELRADENGSAVLEGYAAVFNQEADIMGMWKERIRPGAFTDTLKRGDPVYALFNHDPSQVLTVNVRGDGSHGGLYLHEDRTGLKTTIHPDDTDIGNRVTTLVRNKTIHKMSFAFMVEDEIWSRKDGVDIREITRAKLFDVSPVTYPAYEGTSISARAHEARAAFVASFVEPEPPDGGTEPEGQPTDAAWETDIEAERLRNVEVHSHGV